MTTLIIARHGNTFEDGEPPRRVGARTDISLTDKGKLQSRALGQYLKANNLLPHVTYTSTLKRTQESAQIALAEAGLSTHIYPLKIFDEIDYGPDENQAEDKVIARIGAQALKDWDEKGIVPSGWAANKDEIIQYWSDFLLEISTDTDSISSNKLDIPDIVLVLTSNGIARFAPFLTNNHDLFLHNNTLKLSTGNLGILQHSINSSGNPWEIKAWNIRPELVNK